MVGKISLLPDEQVVWSSDKEVLALTTKRVRYNSLEFGRSNLISITLDSIASCGLITRSYPIFLIVALFGVLIAFIQGGDTQTILLLVAAALVVIFLMTRGKVLSISSNGGQKIVMPAKRMKREAIVELIEAIEREKLK